MPDSSHSQDCVKIDLDGNGRVDLGEVAGVAARVGASCGQDRPLVSTSSTQVVSILRQAVVLSLSKHQDIESSGFDRLNPSQAVLGAGHLGLSLHRVEDADGRLQVSIRLDDVALDAGSLAAYGLTLTYDPAQLALERITSGPGLGGILSLGEGKANPAGQVALGGYNLPAGAAAGQIFATIAFRPVGIQPSVIQASRPEAVDNQGRRIEAAVAGTGQVVLSPHLVYVPSVQKSVGVAEGRD